MTVPAVFASSEMFDEHFYRGLARQVDEGSLGPFILAYANANFAPHHWERMRDQIRQGFDDHAERIGNALRSGHDTGDSPDDLLVFLKLMAIGFDRVDTVESRSIGAWEVQFNSLRGLRPPRLAGQAAAGIETPFDPHCFNFNRPFLAQERLWSGELEGREASFFYNKFPFVAGHLLFVPQPLACSPQLLTQEVFDYAWNSVELLARFLPGIGLGYNSYGACASVNHLHFQTFCRAEALPVESTRWRHNGGSEAYPATCFTATNQTEGWRVLRLLHEQRTAYNLTMRPGKLYVLPRRLQDRVKGASWSASGHAWYEMAGGGVVTDRQVFANLAADDIAAELAGITLV